jgi:hypothetical protein
MKWYSQLLGDFGIYLKDYKDYHEKGGRNYMKPVWARFANEELYLMAWQKTKEIYFWRLMLALFPMLFVVVLFIWSSFYFDQNLIDGVYLILTFIGLFVCFMIFKSTAWHTGFWAGVYVGGFEYDPGCRTSVEARSMIGRRIEPYDVACNKVQHAIKKSYLCVSLCLGLLVILNAFVMLSEYSFIVWFYLFIAVGCLGEFIGDEAGLKKGFSMRKSLETTPSEAYLFHRNNSDPHAPLS